MTGLADLAAARIQARAALDAAQRVHGAAWWDLNAAAKVTAARNAWLAANAAWTDAGGTAAGDWDGGVCDPLIPARRLARDCDDVVIGTTYGRAL